jgi:NADH-quinone oxidoreductase subunit G
LLLIGCNPRWEAPVLNARIHKTWLNSALRIAGIGVPYNLTYPVEQLGGSAGVLGAIAKGSHTFAQVLRDAKRPMVIVGSGALARPDSGAILNLAARIASDTGMIGPAGTPAEGGWNGFNVLHNAASRVAALDLGFLPGEGGRDMTGILDGASKGQIDFVYLLGADEFDLNRLGNTFVVYQGTHGDAGAHRADVILPGAAYTEQDGIYVNFEGRAQRSERATFPPGQAKEDWAILRALSDVIGQRLPYDNRGELRRALYADAPHLAHENVLPQSVGADPSIWNNIGVAGGIDEHTPLASTIADFYLTNPIARASETMAECSKVYVTGAMKMAAE